MFIIKVTVGCEKSHSEVLVVKLDHMLRFLEFGEKRKKRIKMCWRGIESNGTIFINGRVQGSTNVSLPGSFCQKLYILELSF